MAITKIQTVTVGSGGAASIEFASIPQTYTDLMILTSLRATNSGPDANTWTDFNATINGLTTNQSQRYLVGTGSVAVSGTGSTVSVRADDTNATASTFSNSSLYIANYASTTTAKSMSLDDTVENNGTNGLQGIQAQLWNSTAAITSISFSVAGVNFAEYSSMTLYGITKGSSGGVTVS